MNRRDFGLGAASLGLLSLAPGVNAQGKRVFRGANPNAVLDAQQAFLTCGRHPRLGYFEAEGVDLEFVNMSSITQAMMSIATKQVDLGSLAPALFLPAMAKEPGLGLIAAYNWLPRNANTVIVLADSPIKTIKDTVGKRIGIRNQGDGGIVQLQLMYTELGLPTTDINFVAVGDVGVAGAALKENKVDAYVSFDTVGGRMEALGFPIRYLPLPPQYARLGSGWFGFRKSDLKENRKQVVGFCRAAAKSTLFAHTNLAQAINIHWELYPDSRSKSKSDDESRKEIETILHQRKDNWIRWPDDADQRFGASTLAEWKSMIEIAARSTNNPQLPQQIGDPSNVFTNELIDEANRFDRNAVIRQAREFRI
ncbi:ABC transporter substrate-binding protein [Xenophilus sp. Marseille-Q4582]|uniref:ABC transporter substrate-binding protein n=1 Tax=Xenophilus sp. Marseille-Q4582 TaxID=2866600 RepID=UPI001CE49D2D|nr:ABC transporter substrate-binding protein [Xenophilus sp. Marseille-Q4582]